MNITLEEKLLRAILNNPQYLIDSKSNHKAYMYDVLAKKGLADKKLVSKHTNLCEYTIRRNGMHRLTKLQKKDNNIISFSDLDRHSTKQLMLTTFVWILIGLSIATIITTFAFGLPNLANSSLMIGFYAVLMIIFIAKMPSRYHD